MLGEDLWERVPCVRVQLSLINVFDPNRHDVSRAQFSLGVAHVSACALR